MSVHNSLDFMRTQSNRSVPLAAAQVEAACPGRHVWRGSGWWEARIVRPPIGVPPMKKTTGKPADTDVIGKALAARKPRRPQRMAREPAALAAP
jgi:hypothetical protein